MKRFENAYNNFTKAENKLQQSSIDFIKSALKKFPDNAVELSNEDYNYACAHYDGGRHPEYASNCFSMVTYVYLKNNNVYLTIEETDEYEIERASAEDIYTIAYAILMTLENQA